jgi:hypothetical protein
MTPKRTRIQAMIDVVRHWVQGVAIRVRCRCGVHDWMWDGDRWFCIHCWRKRRMGEAAKSDGNN